MAHFAEIDENNVVLRVHVVNDSDCVDSDGVENEGIGKAFCTSTWGGTWVQTSYNGKIRTRYAGIGYTYDETFDAFIPPKPYESWVLDPEFLDWKAPIPQPEDDLDGALVFAWDELEKNWVAQPLPDPTAANE